MAQGRGVPRAARLENLAGAIIAISRAGLPPDAIKDRVLPRLRQAVPFDAAFWALVDPTTLLFTQAHQEAIPGETIPYFIHNEFVDEDVNKWTTLARDGLGVRTLAAATRGEMEESARYRDIFRPLGFGDELRAVLRLRSTCWGYLCLHREAGATFSADEVRYVRRLAPFLAEGIRTGLLSASIELQDAADGPGLVVVARDGSVASTTEAGERWLEELGYGGTARTGLPSEIHALAAKLRAADATERRLPTLTVRAPSGRWAVLHASRLPMAELDAIAVIIEQPSPSALAPVLMLAYGLTSQERAVTRLVCRGCSTRELADRLHITPNTVQDHLKSIFDKTGVSSRRELVATILREQYLPRMMHGSRVAASGFFAPDDGPPGARIRKPSDQLHCGSCGGASQDASTGDHRGAPA
jgi:DNA-binding CsgD family transcriptional regulator